MGRVITNYDTKLIYKRTTGQWKVLVEYSFKYVLIGNRYVVTQIHLKIHLWRPE